jgi:creatinine amidohydrolase
MKIALWLTLGIASTAVAATVLGQAGALSKGSSAALPDPAAPDPAAPDPSGPRPIPALDTVFTENMTWMEVRDALAQGKNTVIVPTGGVEQSGPYLVTGKHDVILRGTMEATARKLGSALVAPTIPFVPQGDINPPTVHMKYPGTISLTEETYERLLEEICACFRTHGFAHVILLGDSGGNQAGMRAVAERLSQRWPHDKTRVHYIRDYYNYGKVAAWLAERGVQQVPEGLHDDFAITAQMMAVDPESVRMRERRTNGTFHINGIDLAPPERTIEWGRRIMAFRAEVAATAIRRAIAGESRQ